MIARQGTWSELEIGSYLRDKAGVVWKIEKEREGHFLMVNRAGDRKHVQPRPGKTPITIMEIPESEALALLKEQLGAEILAERERTGNNDQPWIVPMFPGMMHMARSHMKLLHGVHCDDVKTMKELIEAHVSFSEKPGHAHLPHVHRR